MAQFPTTPLVSFAPKARNFLIREITHPCARPWYLYVETFSLAFLKLLLTVAILDLDDHFRRAAVASVGADVRPGGKGGRARHFVKMILPDETNVSRRVFRQGLITVLKLTIPLEIIGFSWLLYSATDRFFYDWQTLLDKSDFCSRPPDTGPMSRTDPPAIVLSSPTGQGFGYNTLVQNRAGWFNSPLSANIPEGNVSVFATLSLKRAISPLEGVRLRIRTNIAGRVKDNLSDPQNFQNDDFKDLIVRHERRVGVGQVMSVDWSLVGPASPAGLLTDGGDVYISNSIS